MSQIEEEDINFKRLNLLGSTHLLPTNIVIQDIWVGI